jgi:3-dehydroquinate dehydratase-2
MKIYVINGPNLNMLGIREPKIYGNKSYADLIAMIKSHCLELNIDVVCYQSNHEGDLIDWVQEFGAKGIGETDGIVLNAGGYTHTSVALRDAVACSRIPIVEVHVSDITQREEFRRVSLLTDVCAYSVIGQGTDGYRQAVEWILGNCTAV